MNELYMSLRIKTSASYIPSDGTIGWEDKLPGSESLKLCVAEGRCSQRTKSVTKGKDLV
jgi:hypothetical protein